MKNYEVTFKDAAGNVLGAFPVVAEGELSAHTAALFELSYNRGGVSRVVRTEIVFVGFVGE